MANLNFKLRFAESVRNLSKRQTIRPFGKHTYHVGEKLHFFSGMRTPDCQRLREPALLVRVRGIHLTDGAITIARPGEPIHITDPEKLNEFAVKDGFANWPQMAGWFRLQYSQNVLHFTGQLLEW